MERRSFLKSWMVGGAAAVVGAVGVKVWRPGPSDVIVVELGEHPPDSDLCAMREALERVFPGRRVLVLAGGARFSVYREDPAAPCPECNGDRVYFVAGERVACRTCGEGGSRA